MTRPRPIVAVGAAVLSVAGVLGVVAYLQSRDDATVATAQDTGRLRPAGAKPAVKRGNVLLLYSDARQAPALRALRRDLGGAAPELAAAGQAVLVRRDEALPAPVVALSARHRLQARAASDPAVRDFVEYWLGRAAG